MGYAEALLAQGWIALARGDGPGAVRLGAEAAAAARARRDRAAIAESLELQALAAAPSGESERLEEAGALWRELGSPIGAARVDLAQALLRDDEQAAAAATETLRALGARGYGPFLARLLGRHEEAALAIQALGRFRVVRSGRPVALAEWQSRKARDLLKILVARRGRPVTREQLMEALWPGQDPAPLGNRLSVALSTARSVLDPDKRFDADHFVTADRETIALRSEAVVVDVERFLAEAARALALRRARSTEAGELLARAEALYSGDFLEENAYDDWAITLREEARAVYVDLVRALAEDAAERDDADAAVRYFLRVLEKDPYDEEAHLGLVSALETAGRHGEARRHFRAYAARMDELGIESAPFPVT
jgi:DNA-binding SARP family transcriptional activator